MMMQDVWGPWIDHDGFSPCPVMGQWVQVEYLETMRIAEGIAGTHGGYDGWVWQHPSKFIASIIRYRVREPRALRTLREIASNPEPMPISREDELA